VTTDVPPAALVAASTLGILSIGEHFVHLAAGTAAYGAAWWLLRDEGRQHRP